MSEKPQTGPSIKLLASRFYALTAKADFIGRDGRPYDRDYEADARWFVAQQLATEMVQDYKTKDWAHFVLEGMQPLTDEDVRDYLVEGTPTDEEIIAWYF